MGLQESLDRSQTAESKVTRYCEAIMARVNEGRWYSAEEVSHQLYIFLREDNRKKRGD